MTLCIEAKGTAPLHFTWLHNDKVVEGADGPVLTLNGVNEAASGSYVCQVENQVGKTVSKPAKLQVGEWQNFVQLEGGGLEFPPGLGFVRKKFSPLTKIFYTLG